MLKTLRFEVHMPSSDAAGKKIKIKRTFEGHFPGLIWHIFLGSIEATAHEWRARKNWLLRKLAEHVSLNRNVLESEIRIVVLIFLNLIATTWIINQNFFVFSLPYNYARGETGVTLPSPENQNPDLAGMTRLDSERSKDQEDSKKEEAAVIIDELNKLISSQDERCQKDKNDERCTELCVKNEEEIIAQMKAEERQAWMKYLSSKPKLLGPTPSRNISCAKDTKGARNSPNKGKHRDEDCCPDPDEWPRPGCRYSAAGLALMMRGPK
ncbi:MAG TPA: hypothetical protein VK255_01110 [Patescibacteria group bacterium]|nr:hypothetical protein [Patescibacteria group bacterium]